MSMRKAFRVSYKNSTSGPYSVLLEHRNREETLLFESGAVAVLSTQETECVKKLYTMLLDAYGCSGILQVSAPDGVIYYLVLVTGCASVGKIRDAEIFRITQVQLVSLRGQQGDEERLSDVKKILNLGTFYFSSRSDTFDLSLCSQRHDKTSETDNRFFWNRILHTHLMRFGVDTSAWLVKIICGAVEIRTVYMGHKQAKACLISRLSCERAGTRFNVRGANDDGQVANFVETEQVIFTDDETTSFVQTRGSVPLFWEQPGVQVGSHKVRFARGTEASAPAFDKHMRQMKRRYGSHVIVNLLGASMLGSKQGEATLSEMFKSHHRASSHHHEVPHLLFDYHAECRSGNLKNLSKLKERLGKSLEVFGFYYARNGKTFSEQKGVVRTNCLDCLDRTNCVQTFLALQTLPKQLQCLGLSEKPQIASRFQEAYSQMWVTMGNEISRIYAGTGAIQGGNVLVDGARSAARTIQNNLLDYSKQGAIEMIIVGSHLEPDLRERARLLLPKPVLHGQTELIQAMVNRQFEFTRHVDLRLAVGTYNVNGGKHFRSIVYKDRSLSDWLLDAPKNDPKCLTDVYSEGPPDIFALGFEEIVDLNASSIMAASTENAKAWEKELSKTITREEPYILLTSVQLVGVCLFVFVRPHLAEHIRDVATDSVKTGLRGATGNKGGVAIRFSVYNSSMAFVCGHFAAGQSQVTDRNADYQEISKKLLFPGGRTLMSHDYIVWCGDFNYRVDLPREQAKELARGDDFSLLIENDQLRAQQSEGNIFNKFSEADINFPPTYKYDLFSDDYDTSDKARIPAYTDRVLWRRRKMLEDVPDDWSPGKCRYYGTADLRQSDHRPVICILDIQVQVVDEDSRSDVMSDVIAKLGPPDGTIVITPETIGDGGSVEAIFDDKFIDSLLEEFSSISEVTLIRFVENTMWVTFKEGAAALTALKLNGIEICGHVLDVRLRSSDWQDYVRKELELFSENTVPFYDVDESTELGVDDDLATCTPSLSEMQEYYGSIDEGAGGDDGDIRAPPRPAPPSRPPRPAPSPLRVIPKVAVISRPARPPPASSNTTGAAPPPLPPAPSAPSTNTTLNSTIPVPTMRKQDSDSGSVPTSGSPAASTPVDFAASFDHSVAADVIIPPSKTETFLQSFSVESVSSGVGEDEIASIIEEKPMVVETPPPVVERAAPPPPERSTPVPNSAPAPPPRAPPRIPARGNPPVGGNKPPPPVPPRGSAPPTPPPRRGQ